MLSENQVLNRRPKEDYPLLPAPRTVRIKFRKVGNLQYISHLDLQRTISRVLIRAGIPTWYTKGFNPHAKITFGLPLSVGAESLCEYLDIRIERDMGNREIKQRLNEALTEELCVLDVYTAPEKSIFADIVWAKYDIRIRAQGVDETVAQEMQGYLTTSPLMMDKKSKSGIRQVDITTLIRSLDAYVEAGELHLDAILCVSGADYLNPEYLITALRERFGILPEGDISGEYSILRTNVYLADGETEFK
jgi:radical SAM-linked protein